MYCLYLVLSDNDNWHLSKNIVKINEDCPSTWNHYKNKGFHFQLTKWSKNFNFANVLKLRGPVVNGLPDIIVINQSTSGLASVQVKWSEFDVFTDKLARLGLSGVKNEYKKGIIGYTDEMPSGTAIDDAAKFIIKANWYLVKVERRDKLNGDPVKNQTSVSELCIWRTCPDQAKFFNE